MTEQEKNEIIYLVQQKLVTSGILDLQCLAVDADTLIEAVDDYAQKAQSRYGNPYGNRTIEQIAAWIEDEFESALGQSDAGM